MALAALVAPVELPAPHLHSGPVVPLGLQAASVRQEPSALQEGPVPLELLAPLVLVVVELPSEPVVVAVPSEPVVLVVLPVPSEP